MPYDRLIGASGDLRAAHAAVLAGKHGDVRSAGKSHEEAIDSALKATVGILSDAGQPVTDATRQAIATTLRALPGVEPSGQLTKTLQPGGFEMLAGLPVQNKTGKPTVVPKPAAAHPHRRARQAGKLTQSQSAVPGKPRRRRSGRSGLPNIRCVEKSSKQPAPHVRQRKPTRQLTTHVKRSRRRSRRSQMQSAPLGKR